MKIRKAKKSDMKSLLFIEKNSGHPLPQYNFTEKDFLKFMKNYTILIAENKEPLGYAILNKNFRDGSELYAICIMKKYHNKGLGTMLLKRIIKEVRRIGKNKLYSYCWHKNFPSIVFHTKNRFYIVGIDKKHYSGGETALLFCKDL